MKKLPVVTVDVETYYDQEYSLSGKINMSEYIRDDRFHIHGVGIKIDDKPATWHTGADIRTALEALKTHPFELVAHNAAFDGFILSHHFQIIPNRYIDTLSMARAAFGVRCRHSLQEVSRQFGLAGKIQGVLESTKGQLTLSPEAQSALGAYCLNDVDMTYQVYQKLKEHIPEEEMELIDMTMRMFCDPVLEVDMDRVKLALEQEVGSKVAALFKAEVPVEKLMSNQKFAALLEAEGYIPPLKTSKTTGQRTYAFARTDEGFQALLNSPSEKIRHLAQARLKVRSTIGETRANRFLEAGKDGMKLPVLLNYCGAHTTRWSGGNKMNMQNLQRGSELRKSILAPKGHVLVVGDLAQIEARLTAWLAGHSELLKAFADGQDVYRLFASKIYNKPPEELTKLERHVGKVCVLALGYGMGHKKLRETLRTGEPSVRIDLSEAARIVDLYRWENRRIVDLWDQMTGILESMLTGQSGTFVCMDYGPGYITLPSGLFLQYPAMLADWNEDTGKAYEISYSTSTGRNKIYGGLLTENLVQGLARCVISSHMITLNKKHRVVTMSHDEIVQLVLKKYESQAVKLMAQVMSVPPDWCKDLPLAVEVWSNTCYSKKPKEDP